MDLVSAGWIFISVRSLPCLVSHFLSLIVLWLNLLNSHNLSKLHASCSCVTHHLRKSKSFWRFYRTQVRSLAVLVTHSLTHSLTSLVPQPTYHFFSQMGTLSTHWLTHFRLINLIDVTLACEEAKSNLVEVVTAAESWGSCWQQFVADLKAEVWS